jgi:hypothetical protein
MLDDRCNTEPALVIHLRNLRSTEKLRRSRIVEQRWCVVTIDFALLNPEDQNHQIGIKKRGRRHWAWVCGRCVNVARESVYGVGLIVAVFGYTVHPS